MRNIDEIREQELISRAEKELFQELNGFSDEENEFIRWKFGEQHIQCCSCDKMLNLSNKNEIDYDYMGNAWCKPCMKEEMQRVD